MVFIAMMCEDPEEHKFIKNKNDASPTLPGELKKTFKRQKLDKFFMREEDKKECFH